MTGLLAVVLDCLLPGSAVFPSASQVGVPEAVGAIGAVEMLLARLPDEFVDLPSFAQAACLEKLEADDRGTFGQVVAAAYTAYYTNPAVAAAIARATGYLNKPPLPEGYELPPFDERMLDKPRQRPPHYREP